jgi:hypothetical protein
MILADHELERMLITDYLAGVMTAIGHDLIEDDDLAAGHWDDLIDFYTAAEGDEIDLRDSPLWSCRRGIPSGRGRRSASTTGQRGRRSPRSAVIAPWRRQHLRRIGSPSPRPPRHMPQNGRERAEKRPISSEDTLLPPTVGMPRTGALSGFSWRQRISGD